MLLTNVDQALTSGAHALRFLKNAGTAGYILARDLMPGLYTANVQACVAKTVALRAAKQTVHEALEGIRNLFNTPAKRRQ